MFKNSSRVEIDYFKVEGTAGGSQAWFPDYWMNLAGCGALAACDLAICLAANKGLMDCIPYDPKRLTREDYINLGMAMKPYIRPRIGGVARTSIFTRGFGRYLMDRGYRAEFAVCPGESSYEEACRFVRRALEYNLPIAYLLLRHKDSGFKNISWHWFMITGYIIKEGRMFLIYHTYGRVETVDFEKLWHTGMRRKGGMVTLKSFSL